MALTGFLFAGGPVQAQESDVTARDVAEFEEIVVTSRYREENVQDVPISATVMSKTLIEDARLDRVDDVMALVPNVTFRQTQNAGQSFVMIRGLTQVRNNEPPVAVVIDGVLTASPNQLARELFDLQSIEVLRGPQGALYGRNATGGAILITTRKPQFEFGGYVRGGYATGNEKFIEGGITGPLVKDKLAASLNAKYLDRDGYYRNITLDQNADPFEELSLQGKLLWTPADDWTANLRVNYIKNDAAALNVWFQPTILDQNNKFAGFDFTPGNPQAAVSPNSADSVFKPLVANACAGWWAAIFCPRTVFSVLRPAATLARVSWRSNEHRSPTVRQTAHWLLSPIAMTIRPGPCLRT